MRPLLSWTAEPPALRRPVLVVALEGFVDAGAVAATASMFVRHRWRAERVAVFDRDALLDYRARRPSAVVDGGRLRQLTWQELELLAAQVDGPHDALLLLGPEPDMRWEAFLEAVVDACRRVEVEGVVGLGAYPAATPHTRPTRIMRAFNDVAGGLVADATDIPGYSGPVGAGTALQAALGRAGIPAVGLWAEVPHYIAGAPNPAGALAMVRVLAAALRTSVDTTELQAAVKLHDEQVAEAVAQHPDAREMVAMLERHFDAGGREQDLPSGDDLAAEIERFLRSQSD